MSTRNNQSSKAAARERLRQERERQARKDRFRRQGIVAGAAVVLLAIAGGVGYAVVQSNKPSHWVAAEKETHVVAPKNTSGTNGTTVVIGKATAPKTLEVFEDSRCPICAQFEQTVGKTVQNDIDAGKFKIQYVGATFIDNSDNGTGSKNALSALGAALNVSPEAFLQYKTALYSTNFHPEESDDKFSKDSYLLQVADSVNALKGNAAFQKDVKEGIYDAWAMKMSAAFDKSGVQGTPTFKMDGKTLTAAGSQNPPMTVAEFDTAISAALKG